MTGPTNEDRDRLDDAILRNNGGHYAAVEAIVARAVNEALTEAARSVERDLGGRRAMESADFTDGLVAAARIVRARTN